MKYVSGRTLMQVLEERRILPPAEALPIFDEILQALEPAGQEAVLRPVNPSTIVIGHDNRVTVVGFGSDGLSSSLSNTTDVASTTLHYRSPEEISGQAADLRSHIFSLGAVLYETLTGERPFTAETSAALNHKILEVEPVPPRVLNIKVPDLLDDLIRKALAKNPADRFQTPAEMLTALRTVSQSLGGAVGGRNRSTFAGGGQRSDEAFEISPEDRGRTGAPLPPPPGATVTSPQPLPEDVTMTRSEAETATGKREPASRTEPGKLPRKDHAAGLPLLFETDSREETESGRPRPVLRTLGSLAVLVVLLGAGGLVLWRLLPAPVEQASSLPGASTGLLAGNGQNNTAEGELRGSVDALVDQARSLWETDPDNTRMLLEQAAALDPNHFDATFQLARFLTFKKDFPAAIQQYQNALRINDQVPDVFFNLGYIYLQQEALDQAIQYYEACRALSPPYLDEVLTNLAVCHWKKNNPAQAEMFLRQALDLNPNNELAHNYLNMLQKVAGTHE